MDTCTKYSNCLGFTQPFRGDLRYAVLSGEVQAVLRPLRNRLVAPGIDLLADVDLNVSGVPEHTKKAP